MCKKFIFVCVLVLGLVSTSYGTVIGDWEAASFDGWSGGQPSVILVPSLSQPSAATTLGQGHLGVSVGQQNNPYDTYWSLKRTGIVDLTGMTAITVDVTFIAAEWQVNWNWLKVDKLAINSDGPSGWQEFYPTVVNRDGSPGATLDWGAWNPDAYRTYSWDLTTLVGGYDATGATFMEIIIALQNPNAYPTGFFYLDNAQVIPEPTTIALLGFGGLSLLRIRRKR